MQQLLSRPTRSQPAPTFNRKRLQAILEIVDGEVRIYPIAENDIDASEILDQLRFISDDK